ncbi:MAG: Phosphate ABC transporter substrate-binding protein [Clostridium sp.]|jgi:phosphate transport system substrate-binding protein
MKEWIWSVPMTLLLSLSLLACSGDVTSTSTPNSGAADSSFDPSKEIMVVSREEGSGTRGAFVELFGVEVKNDQGEKEDMTTEEADISNSTNVVMTTVANNEDAIGYISLGSLNDTVKAVKINDVEPTVDNIKSGDYRIARPFNIAVMGQVSDAAQDFIDFIMSADGQKVIEENGYIPVSDQPAYNGSNPGGKITVGGSSSVTPVMEKLKEAYLAVNPNADIEVQVSDSTTGMTSAIDGICDIGMASRELKESELEKGLKPTVIAMDGIAVVVNKNNPVDNMTIEQVRSIYTGETTVWSKILE